MAQWGMGRNGRKEERDIRTAPPLTLKYRGRQRNAGGNPRRPAAISGGVSLTTPVIPKP